MIVLWTRRASGEAPIHIGKIVRLQVGVGSVVAVDPLASEFLHQAVLMHSVLPFHTPFGLRRVGRQDAGSQLCAHAPELRQRLLAAQSLERKSTRLNSSQIT